MHPFPVFKAAALTVFLGFAAQVAAAPLNGTAAIGSSGADETGMDLLSRSSFTVERAFVSNTSGDFNIVPTFAAPRTIPSTAITIGTFDTVNPASFSARGSIGGHSGTFRAGSYTQVTRRADSLSGMFTGTFTPDGPGSIGAFTGGSAVFRINLDRSIADGDATVSFTGSLALVPDATEQVRVVESWGICACFQTIMPIASTASVMPASVSDAAPRTDVPEPASVASLGVGLFGSAIVRRRRRG